MTKHDIATLAVLEYGQLVKLLSRYVVAHQKLYGKSQLRLEYSSLTPILFNQGFICAINFEIDLCTENHVRPGLCLTYALKQEKYFGKLSEDGILRWISLDEKSKIFESMTTTQFAAWLLGSAFDIY